MRQHSSVSGTTPGWYGGGGDGMSSPRASPGGMYYNGSASIASRWQQTINRDSEVEKELK